jgi:hypothetical protein
LLQMVFQEDNKKKKQLSETFDFWSKSKFLSVNNNSLYNILYYEYFMNIFHYTEYKM